MSPPVALRRARAAGLPAADPACAGCAQLALFRALRRAGVELQGGLGCDPAAEAPIVPGAGRWAAVTGAGRLLRGGATAWLGAAASAGARFAVVADRVGPVRSTSLEDALARAGAPVVRLDLEDAAATEGGVREALEWPGSVLLALSPCVRGEAARAPVAVDASRCNRCGGCLSLACPALADGGEAVAVDAQVCTGCGRCEPLCRSRALGRPAR